MAASGGHVVSNPIEAEAIGKKMKLVGYKINSNCRDFQR